MVADGTRRRQSTNRIAVWNERDPSGLASRDIYVWNNAERGRLWVLTLAHLAAPRPHHLVKSAWGRRFSGVAPLGGRAAEGSGAGKLTKNARTGKCRRADWAPA